MTPEEIVRKAIGTYPLFEASIAWMAMVRAVKMAQAAERERCAKIAEESDIGPVNHWPTGKGIAAKIRQASEGE